MDLNGGEAIDNNSPSSDYTPHISYLQLSFVDSILYFSMTSTIKLPILLMYHRIFSVDPSFYLHSLLVGVFISVFWLATTIATLPNCIPLEYSWIGLSDPNHCFNYNIFWMVTGALEGVIETVILALPMRMMFGLQLSRERKVFLLLIFLLGGLYVIPVSLIPPALFVVSQCHYHRYHSRHLQLRSWPAGAFLLQDRALVRHSYRHCNDMRMPANFAPPLPQT